eukprot:69140-Pleurochrysis_carterae.AAC.1
MPTSDTTSLSVHVSGCAPFESATAGRLRRRRGSGSARIVGRITGERCCHAAASERRRRADFSNNDTRARALNQDTQLKMRPSHDGGVEGPANARGCGTAGEVYTESCDAEAELLAPGWLVPRVEALVAAADSAQDGHPCLLELQLVLRRVVHNDGRRLRRLA